MSGTARLSSAVAVAGVVALLLADVHVMGVAFWKIVLAVCGIALFRLAGST